MDFGVVDNLVCSNSSTAAFNNGGTVASETNVDLTSYGSTFLSRKRTAAEDDKISSCGGATAKVSLPESNNGGGFNQQMLGFSAYYAPPLPFPFFRASSGYGFGGVNGTSLCGVKGPFTTSQWMELEHQALIYKYITANVPIPSSLLIPIRKAFESSGFSGFSLLRPNTLGWGGFHLGFSKNDPEPGRCRRTDGKKWRCSREAIADQKYCERHMNRGRHRSRKPVEGGITMTPKASSPAPLLHHHQQTNNDSSRNRCPANKESTPAKKICFRNNQHSAYTHSEFGSVCSDSLLNPLNRSLCREFEATQMGLGVGSVHFKQNQRHSSWVPISWEPSIGGPLGEALHNKVLDLMETRLPSSPLGAHRGAFVGTSPGSESKTLDGASFYNELIGPGLMLPSLPAL